MADYVNATAEEGRNSSEKRENCQSGWSKVFLVVGVSFGLLCIVQSALNVSLRLQGRGTSFFFLVGFCNNSDLICSTNITMMSALLREKDQLEKENRELQVDNNNQARENDVLNDKLREYENYIKELLKERLSETEVTNLQSCPQEWYQYTSSCYWLSPVKMTWWQAKKDCEAKGAHLVILNDDNEECVLITKGRSDVWIGLKAKKRHQKWTWTWVDGTSPTSYHHLPDAQHFPCAYSANNQFVYWASDTCNSQHYWMCEKELK
ncbi:killer cell lectin-like receptor subfamily B member 1A isoform X1 [Dicentrarchus labrax]|uniref:killer cell lectin-like receptor subfamily B member 1A isoform X1 n=1 Tax=Dicentrarchus labrax TaxID=13489 RepID=UPI0021F62D3D|nr:killer cell lectin-like receptor subfamily B member 1A isoform X1 [Dicentrarchus labrax]